MHDARMDTAPLLWILATLLIVAGLVGTVLPALPGVTLVFAGLFVAAWADDFTRVGWVTLVVLGVQTRGEDRLLDDAPVGRMDGRGRRMRSAVERARAQQQVG